jgi:hypothetical protein
MRSIPDQSDDAHAWHDIFVKESRHINNINDLTGDQRSSSGSSRSLVDGGLAACRPEGIQGVSATSAHETERRIEIGRFFGYVKFFSGYHNLSEQR